MFAVAFLTPYLIARGLEFNMLFSPSPQLYFKTETSVSVRANVLCVR